MIYNIKQNSQRNNNSFSGLFPGSWQCFTTSQWMKGSHYSENINATDDEGLSKYLNDIEISISGGELGENLTKGTSIKKWSSIYWDIQQKAFTKLLNENGIEGHDIFSYMTYEEIQEYILDSPITVGTEKIGGLPGGHVILCIGISKDGTLIFNDPYGNANTNYKNYNGAQVQYDKNLLTKNQDKLKVLYWRNK